MAENRQRAPRVSVKCGQCKKDLNLTKRRFEVKTAASKSGFLFCSNSCHRRFVQAAKAPIECQCKWCKKKFKRTRKMINRANKNNQNGIFCSSKCSTQFRYADFRLIFKTEKTCKKCKTIKSMEMFSLKKTSKDGRQSHCRKCRSQAMKATNRCPKERAAYGKKYYNNLTAEEKKKRAHKMRASRHGLTAAQLDLMFKESNNRCAICKSEKELNIDHCHSTGAVRGLLCRECNLGIGNLNDSPTIMAKAIEYVKSGTDFRNKTAW